MGEFNCFLMLPNLIYFFLRFSGTYTLAPFLALRLIIFVRIELAPSLVAEVSQGPPSPM